MKRSLSCRIGSGRILRTINLYRKLSSLVAIIRVLHLAVAFACVIALGSGLFVAGRLIIAAAARGVTRLHSSVVQVLGVLPWSSLNLLAHTASLLLLCHLLRIIHAIGGCVHIVGCLVSSLIAVGILSVARLMGIRIVVLVTIGINLSFVRILTMLLSLGVVTVMLLGVGLLMLMLPLWLPLLLIRLGVIFTLTFRPLRFRLGSWLHRLHSSVSARWLHSTVLKLTAISQLSDFSAFFAIFLLYASVAAVANTHTAQNEAD